MPAGKVKVFFKVRISDLSGPIKSTHPAIHPTRFVCSLFRKDDDDDVVVVVVVHSSHETRFRLRLWSSLSCYSRLLVVPAVGRPNQLSNCLGATDTKGTHTTNDTPQA